MRHSIRGWKRWRLLIPLALLWSLPIGGEARAGVEDEPADLPRIKRAFDVENRSLYTIEGVTLIVQSVAVPRPIAPRQEMAEEQQKAEEDVELRIFRGTWSDAIFGPRDDVEGWQKRLGLQLDARISLIVQVFELNADQKEKLRLAGRGDIQRLKKRIDELRTKMETPIVVESEDSIPARRWMAELATEARDLRAAVNDDLFLEGSLLSKVLRRLLTPEQIATYEARELKLRSVPLGIRRSGIRRGR